MFTIPDLILVLQRLQRQSPDAKLETFTAKDMIGGVELTGCGENGNFRQVVPIPPALKTPPTLAPPALKRRGPQPGRRAKAVK